MQCGGHAGWESEPLAERRYVAECPPCIQNLVAVCTQKQRFIAAIFGIIARAISGFTVSLVNCSLSVLFLLFWLLYSKANVWIIIEVKLALKWEICMNNYHILGPRVLLRFPIGIWIVDWLSLTSAWVVSIRENRRSFVFFCGRPNLLNKRSKVCIVCGKVDVSIIHRGFPPTKNQLVPLLLRPQVPLCWIACQATVPYSGRT